MTMTRDEAVRTIEHAATVLAGDGEPTIAANLIAALAALASDTGERWVAHVATGHSLLNAALRAQPAGGGEAVVRGEGFQNGGFAVVYVNGTAYTPEQLAAALPQPQSVEGGCRYCNRADGCGDEGTAHFGVMPRCLRAPPESGGQGEAVGCVRRTHHGPHGVLYAALLPTGPNGPNVKEGDILYTHPPAQTSGVVTEVMVALADSWDSRADATSASYSGGMRRCANELRELTQGGGNGR